MFVFLAQLQEVLEIEVQITYSHLVKCQMVTGKLLISKLQGKDLVTYISSNIGMVTYFYYYLIFKCKASIIYIIYITFI